MDTLAIGARCALLILTTFVFAILWSGDRPNPVAVITRPGKSPVDDRSSNPANRVHIYESPRDDVPGDSTWIKSPLDVNAPMPADIASGTYLIVDQAGHSELRTIAGSNPRPDGGICNHYTVEAGGSRWHFIRLEPNSIDRTAIRQSNDSIVR